MSKVAAPIHVNRHGDAGVNLKTAKAGNLEISFENDPQKGAARFVTVRDAKKGKLTLQVGVGQNYGGDLNGKRIEARGDQLFIDGRRFDFETGKLDKPATAEKAEAADQTPKQKLQALKDRFPGVHFAGDLGAAGHVLIDDTVKIAPGATIELVPGLTIGDRAKIGKDAKIRGGEIFGGEINGTVTGGVVWDAKIEAGAIVTGGIVDRSTLEKGARVSGGEAQKSTLGPGAEVTGGQVLSMRLGKDSKISSGYFEGFALNGGSWFGGHNVGGIEQPDQRQQRSSRAAKDGPRGENWDTTLGVDRNAFQNFVQMTLGQLGGPRHQPYAQQPMFQMDYSQVNQAYDPRLVQAQYQQFPTQQYGGSPMPPGLYGPNTQVVAQQENPLWGFGKAALMGMGAMSLLNMGIGAFGMGTYGMGMGWGGMGMGMGWGGMGMGMGMGGWGGMGMGMGMGGWGGGWGW